MRSATVIVNWRGWADTIECLESVFRSERPATPVVVCDNDSGDGSLERIREWAEGRLEAGSHPGPPLRELTTPPVRKPVRYVEYDRATAERGGERDKRDVPLVLVRTGGNLGFAGGTNVGLRYLLRRGDRDAVWLLNNDTVIRPESLGELEEALAMSPRVGMVGSTLVYYDEPDRVQTLGGARYNRWLAISRNIGGSVVCNGEPRAIPGMAYVAGASLLVRLSLVREVGLLNEEYFLYFEELDWAERARGSYLLAHAPRSVVYHKEGRSIGGGSAAPAEKSLTADYFFNRNRILFTRRYHPWALPTVYGALLVTMLRRVGRRQWDRVGMIAKLLWSA